MKSLARILAQLVISGPILLLMPWAVFMGIGTIYSLAKGNYWGISNALGFGLGWLGLFGLYLSIFIPLQTLRESQKLHLVVLLLLGVGFVATLAITFERGGPIGLLAEGNWGAAYSFVGPLVVSAWNLVRIFREEPHPPHNPDSTAAS